MNLSKAHVTISGCVHEFIYHWNCLFVLHSSIFRTANFYWRHLRLLCLPVLFGHLETFSKWSKSLNLKNVWFEPLVHWIGTSLFVSLRSLVYLYLAFNKLQCFSQKHKTNTYFTMFDHSFLLTWGLLRDKKKVYIVLSELLLFWKTLRQNNFINYRRPTMIPTQRLRSKQAK